MFGDKQKETATKLDYLKKAIAIQGDTLEATTSKYKAQSEKVKENAEKLELAKKKLDELRASETATTEEIEKAEKSVEKQTKAYDNSVNTLINYERQVNDQQTALNKLKNEFNETEAELNALSGEFEKSLTPLERQKQKLEELSQTFKKFGDSMKEIGSKISSFGSELSMKITAPLSALAGLSYKYASDWEDSLNAVNVIFGENAEAMLEWNANLNDIAGLADSEANQITSSIGGMFKSIGIEGEELTQKVQDAVMRSADMASFYGGTTEEANKAVEAGLKGNYEQLEKYNIKLSETDLERFAKEQGLVWRELDNSEKSMFRYNVIMQQTEMVAGDYANTADGASNTMKTFGASIKDLSVAFGKHLLPVFTPIIDKLNDMVVAFSNLSERTQKTILVVAGIAAAIGPVLVAIGTVVSAVGSIAGALGSVTNLIAGFGGITGAIGAVGTSFATVILPIVAIGTAIAGLILAFKNLYETNEEFRIKVTETLHILKRTFEKIFSEIKDFVVSVFNELKVFWDKWGNDILSVFNIVFDLVFTVLQTVFTRIIKWWDKWGDDVLKVFKTVFDTVMFVIDTALTFIKFTFETLQKFWDEWGDEITTFFKITFDLLFANIKLIFNGIQLFWDKWGDTITSGVKLFVSVNGKILKASFEILSTIVKTTFSTISNIIDTALKTIQNIFGIFSSAFKGDWESVWKYTKQLFTDIWDGMQKHVELVLGAVQDVGKSIGNVFTGLVDNAKNWGKNMITGFADGIKASASAVTDAVKGTMSNVKDYLGFNSPSKKGDGRYITVWGSNMVKGFSDGIEAGSNYPVKPIENMMSELATKFKSFNNIGNIELGQALQLPTTNSSYNVASLRKLQAPSSTNTTTTTTTSNNTNTRNISVNIDTKGLFEGAILQVRSDTDINNIANVVIDKLSTKIAQDNRNLGLI